MKSKRKSPLVATLLYGLIAGLLLGISALAIFLAHDRLRQSEAAPFRVADAAPFDGVIVIEPPIEAPDFALSDQFGQTFQLRDLLGRRALLTFGFTNCHDICPLTLGDFQRVQELLGEGAHAMAFVFISVDGRRDQPEALRRYLESRDLAGIIGLTGDEAAVRALGAPFGLSFEVNGDISTGAYMVNHTTGSFLLDARGRWIRRFQFGVAPESIAAEISRLPADNL